MGQNVTPDAGRIAGRRTSWSIEDYGSIVSFV
jgi:hypothetical protein